MALRRVAPLLCLLLIHASANCGPEPLSVPVTDVKLANGALRRGVFGGAGTPPQNVSLNIDMFVNNTWIYNITYPQCMAATPIRCWTARGGLYDPDSSSTSTYHDNVAAAGGDSGDLVPNDARKLWINSWSNDNLEVGNVSLSNFPIGMPGLNFAGDVVTPGAFGMGQNSTLLRHLKDQDYIASRSWSFWWGVSNSASRSAIDGHIIFGGYDAAKVTGEPYVGQIQPSSPDCWSGLTLNITTMTMRFPNGTDEPLNEGDTPIPACILIDERSLMSLPPYTLFEDFENIAQTVSIGRSRGYHWWMPMYSPTDVYDGGLGIQIVRGPMIDVPNDVLVVPDVYTDEAGQTQHNDSAAVLLINDLPGFPVPTGVALGMNFFANAYLHVNLDNSSFSVWTAEPTTDVKLVTIGQDHCEEATETDTVSEDRTSDTVPEDRTSDTTPTAPVNSASLSTGAIAGIVVGGIAGLVAIVGLLMLALRRRSQRQDASQPGTSNASQNHFDKLRGAHGMNFPYARAAGMSEVAGDTAFSAEMAGDTVFSTELPTSRDPVELPRRYTLKDKPGYTLEDAVELPARTTPRI